MFPFSFFGFLDFASVGEKKNTHDTATAWHCVDLGSDTAEDAARIDGEIKVPIRIRHPGDRAGRRYDAGHVDGAVEFAQRLHRGLDPRIDRLAVAHVDDLGHVSPFASGQRLDRGQQRLFVQVAERDDGAAGCEKFGGCETHARGCAGDGDLPSACISSLSLSPLCVQSLGHLLPFLGRMPLIFTSRRTIENTRKTLPKGKLQDCSDF